MKSSKTYRKKNIVVCEQNKCIKRALPDEGGGKDIRSDKHNDLYINSVATTRKITASGHMPHAPTFVAPIAEVAHNFTIENEFEHI